ncbi:MAG: hypothetical protein EOO03_05460 [Chitinophagaceae bacterium]|nr:MAG: hypothetical protein EOO03_05460 [Chitinophagaceae bacterium]
MKLTITIVCFFFTLTLFAQVNDADAFSSGRYDKAFIRRHNIRKVSVESYINGGRSSLSHFEFDSSGFLTKQTVFDSSRKRVNDYFFTYNKHGDQIERKQDACESNKTYVTSYNKTYNGSLLVQETSSELPFVTTYLYNESGKKVQSTVYLTPDTLMSAKQVSLYTYNADGRLIGIQETYIDNKNSLPNPTGTTTYIYNAAGNITDVIREGKANYVLSYDANGLLKSKTTKMPEEFSHIKMVDNYSYAFWK